MATYCHHLDCFQVVAPNRDVCVAHAGPQKSTLETLQFWKSVLSHELTRCISFWDKFSLDQKNGGYHNNLTDQGQVYDPAKQMWLNCREVWMWATLSFESRKRGNAEEAARYLDAARLGMDFVHKNALFDEQKRVYFALTEEGEPLFIQRKQWAECYYVVACLMYGRVSGEEKWEAEGLRMFAHFLEYCNNATLLGRPKLSGQSRYMELGVSMFILALVDEIRSGGNGPGGKGVNTTLYDTEAKHHMENLRLFVHDDRKLVFERIRPDGSPDLTTAFGRCLNPGHAIEGAWFLMRFAQRYGAPQSLVDLGLKMLDYAFENGWDKTYGGILYFTDSEGFSPIQLEANMKLWWPHNEAMIAFLTAYERTSNPEYLQRFAQVTEYSMRTFGQTPHGDWYGYANRQGEVTSRNIGAPYKGFFHVPRAFLYCCEILDRLIQQQ